MERIRLNLKSLSTLLIGVSIILAVAAFYSYPLSEADIASALPNYPSSPKFAGSTVIGVKSRVNATISGIASDYRTVGRAAVILVNTDSGVNIRVVIPGSWIEMTMMHRGCMAEKGRLSPTEIARAILHKKVIIHGVMVEEDKKGFMIAWGIMVFDNHMAKGYMRSDVVEKMNFMMTKMGMNYCSDNGKNWMPMGKR